MPNTRDKEIAVIGSPSTNTELTLDLLLDAITERLVGALTAFRAQQVDPKSIAREIISVGQIVGIELRNKWHEDSVFKNLIKRTGEIPPITSRQDTRTANLVVGATFKKEGEDKFEPEILGMVPPTGTRVFRVDQPLLDKLLKVYQNEIFYLGRAYANEVLYPMWFKHFGRGPQGANEAYHIAIFGKTGSGKSVLAKNIVLAYARHKEESQMGILIIDPQGEFAKEFGAGTKTGQYTLNYKDVCTTLNRKVHIIRIPQIRLDRWGLFIELISRTDFFRRLSIPYGDKIRDASEVLAENMKREKITLDVLHTKDSFDKAIEILSTEKALTQIYASETSKQRVAGMLADKEVTEPLYKSFWLPVTKLFQPTVESGQEKHTIEDVAWFCLRSKNREVVILDLSGAGLSQQDKQTFWDDQIQALFLERILTALIVKAEELYGEEPLNALVVLDEAHRLAGAGYITEESERARLRRKLIDGVRTTRKYGLGWMFVSQSISSIHKSILDQCRIFMFGFGLAIGDEFRRLKDLAGGDQRSMELYQSFRDPQSFPRSDLREFSFMAVGPVSPLSFAGKPLFFSAFTDPQEFLIVNGLAKQNNT